MDIRQVTVQDKPQILELLKTLDLYYHDQSLNDFWVAEDNGKIIGVVRLEEFPDFSFISSLGVLGSHRNKGIATKIINHILTTPLPMGEGHGVRAIYLYTIIPDFFKKLGFIVLEPTGTATFSLACRQAGRRFLDSLPSKSLLECADCRPGKCVTMVKVYNGA